MTETSLTLDEGVHLAYAVVARTAAGAGVRLLAIKGPTLAMQGLREPRTSVDVDVLVEPAGFDPLRAALSQGGWVDHGVYDTPGIVPVHSLNNTHPLFPCELDVHHWFPGFLADPAAVFDVLWERRVEVEIAHTALWTTDPVGSAAIAALHHLRDDLGGETHPALAALVDRVNATWQPEQLRALSQLAADTHASETLGPFLDQVGARRLPATRPAVVPLADWEMRAGADSTEVLPWLVELRRRSWWQRPGFVLRALWLSDRNFETWDPSVRGSRRAVMRARWQRVRRAVRALPAARAELRRSRSGR